MYTQFLVTIDFIKTLVRSLLMPDLHPRPVPVRVPVRRAGTRLPSGDARRDRP